MQQSLMSIPDSRIVGFHQDEDQIWVADLECGHAQHIRHQPPWQIAEWVLSEALRSTRVGTTLPCPLCRMPKLPEGVREYKCTQEFDASNVPAGLLQNHTLKAGVWGEIIVTAGRVLYTIEGEEALSFALSSTVRGVIEPERPHRVACRDGGRFYVRFLRSE